MKISQKEKAIFEMEREGEMKVPGWMFATPSMMEGMKKDRTLWQLGNVAQLDGIIKAAMLMPDGHEGYGFPIGGVAAFDAEDGIVSPGGVGYDINCLPGNTRVLSEDGYNCISDFHEQKYNVLTKNGNNVEVTSPSFFMGLKPKNRVMEITTETGSRVKATEDHPFLTPKGMVLLKDLVIGQTVVMYEDQFYQDRIVNIDEVCYDGFVYDFTIPKTHNFIANGFVVSNCGVRLLTTPLEVNDVRPKIREICDRLFVNVPSGVGSEGKLRVTPAELDEVSTQGIDWAIEKGYGRKQDKERTEEYGRMGGADASVVSPTAKKRGKAQIGTLGAGNHFLEVQVVEKVFDEKAAKSFGLREGMVTVMIHCGSRGFGHQICSDHLESVMGAAKRLNLPMPDRELVYAPLREKEAQNYLKAMKCAVNYAFTNRHVIMHWARESFDSVFGAGTGEKMDLVYDVAHNIAKEEMHSVDGKKRKLLVHRKGATRAFPKGREELPPLYRNVGQPVIIPGSMGTASYVLVGKERSLELSWGSTCHGSGRTMSRHSAIDKHRGQDIAKDLWGHGIYVRATDKRTLAEEAPDAYKNVDEVVKSVEEAGLSGIVARLKPLGVVKG